MGGRLQCGGKFKVVLRMLESDQPSLRRTPFRRSSRWFALLMRNHETLSRRRLRVAALGETASQSRAFLSEDCSLSYGRTIQDTLAYCVKALSKVTNSRVPASAKAAK